MPNFIKRLKHNRPEEESISIGICSGFSRLPFMGLRPRDYQTPKNLINFSTELEKRIKELLKTEIDAGNSNAVDNMVCDVVAIAFEDIHTQRADHIRLIQECGNRWAVDESEARQRLEDYKKELKSTETELARLKTLSQPAVTPRNRTLKEKSVSSKKIKGVRRK